MVTFVCMAFFAVMADPQAEPISPGNPTISVAGEVVGSDGRPLPDAELVLRAQIGGQFYSLGLHTNRDVLATTRTDKAGKFRFEKVGIPPRLVTTFAELEQGRGGVEIIAWAPGHAVKWQTITHFENSTPLRIRLQPEAEVQGEIRDTSDKPLRNVAVRLVGASINRERTDGTFRQPGELNLLLSGVEIATSTDDEGRFRLPHAPLGSILCVSVFAPGYQQQYPIVDTGSEPPVKELKTEGVPRSIPKPPVLRSPLRLTMAKPRSVMVRVTDHAGQPVKEGAVTMMGATSSRVSEAMLNSQGEASLVLLDGEGLTVQYVGDPLQPRLGKTAVVEVPAGDGDFTFDLQLPEEHWITGKVVDEDSGEPLVGVYLNYWTSAKPGVPHSSFNVVGVSQADGTIRLPVAAGPGRVRVINAIWGYFVPGPGEGAAAGSVRIDGDDTSKPFELRLSRGLTIDGVLKDTAGKPAPNVLVQARHLESPYTHSVARTNERGEYRFQGFSPRGDVLLTALADGSCAIALVKGDPKAAVMKSRHVPAGLALQSGVVLTGRVVEEGQPLAGVKLRVTVSLPLLEDGRYIDLGEVETDATGMFRAGGLKPGDRYHFEVRAGQDRYPIDWQHQSPFVSTVGEGPVVTLPDAVLVKHGQRLSGVVVDPDGKPLAGISVSAMSPGGGSLSRRDPAPPPWTETDKEGKFTLSHLPDVALELMAYKRNPRGGSIKYPAMMKTKLNQTDIRIILDPKLDDAAEDLDAPKK